MIHSLLTGVYVQVPSLTNDESTITLSGPQDKMGEALTLVYGKVLFNSYT